MSIFEMYSHDEQRQFPVRVAVLGCTGSIGTQALDVARKHSDKIQITALAAHSSAEKLIKSAHEFGVKHLALANEELKNSCNLDELPEGAELSFGEEAVANLCELDDVDVVIVAVVGACGITSCLKALQADKIVGCANKEPLVAAGDILMPLAKPGRFIPVDSEHSAIYQCIVGENPAQAHRIWLTCSGGPFFGWTKDQLVNVTSKEALAHPNWSMGPKITVDSATLMNKGLEVLEAHHLFNMDVDLIEVLVHRQSKIHSMVEFVDGQVKALIGSADMRGAIQYAISYPDRWEASIERLNFLEEPPLTFAKPDMETFGCLKLAYEAGRVGKTLPCIMNAANEVANAAFRHDVIGFLDIERVVRAAMDTMDVEPVTSIEQLQDVDASARRVAQSIIDKTLQE